MKSQSSRMTEYGTLGARGRENNKKTNTADPTVVAPTSATTSCTQINRHRPVDIGQTDPGQGVVRVELERGFEGSFGAAQTIDVAPADVESPLQVQIVGLAIVGVAFDRGATRAASELHLKLVGDGLGDLVLNREDVIQVTIVNL